MTVSIIVSQYSSDAHAQVCSCCGGEKFTDTELRMRKGGIIITAKCCRCGEHNIMTEEARVEA